MGQTPSVQFLGWRLSLGNAFIILSSKYVSSDSLVAWKSSKFGANFYAPNIFTKSIPELDEKLFDGQNIRYAIDIMIIASISIDDLKTDCELLSKFSNLNTVVLISADFGCELEPIALEYFFGKCKCVMSIFCEVECRQLSLGSYTLVNDEQCVVQLGTSFMTENFNNDMKLIDNEKLVQQEFLDENSNITRFNNLLKVTKWIEINKYFSSTKMALKIWEMIIPKVSLNILSIILEQFDYEKLLETKSTERIFKDLVSELMEICTKQCGSQLEKYLCKDDLSTINYESIIDLCKEQKVNLANSTANEHPEYLSLPFEAYCFYHRFEYPAHILLYQPLLLAKKYELPCSNLNFLFGFYTRLLSLSGLSIFGGRCQQLTSLFEKNLLINLDEKTDQESVKEHDDTNKQNKKGNSEDVYCSMGASDPTLSAELEHLYLSVENYAETHHNLQDDYVELSDIEDPTRNKDLQLVTKRELFSFSEKVSEFSNNRTQSSNVLDGMNGSSSRIDRYNNFIKESTANTNFENLGLIGIPHYTQKYPIRNDHERTGSIQSLEKQLRTSQHLLAKDYDKLNNQLGENGRAITKEEHDRTRRHYAMLELQLWKFQRKFNIYQGIVSRPHAGPYEDLLNHIEILNRGNTGDILPFTTSRYGCVDTFHLLHSEKDKIISLFEKRFKDIQPDQEKARLLNEKAQNHDTE